MRLLALCLLAGCSDRPLPIDDHNDGSMLPACRGNAPQCLATCGSADAVGTASCESGTWQCGKGVSADHCQQDCFGDSTHAETCNNGQWQCQPEEVDFELCPAVLCDVCDGFGGARTEAGCACACSDGRVYCNHVFP